MLIQSQPQLIRCVRLTVGDKATLGRHRDPGKPANNLIAIGVGGQKCQLVDLSPYRQIIAKDAGGTCTIYQSRTAGTTGLVAGKQNGIAVIAYHPLEMVQNPATSGHTAG